MANLEVNNNIFKYKNTGYQIKHISSVRIIERRIKNKNFGKIGYSVALSMKLFVGAAFFGFIFCIAYYLLDNGWIKFWLGAIAVILGMAGVSKFEEYRSEKKKSTNEYYMMYGLSLRLTNGDREVFWSSKKETIKKVHDALIKSINHENVSIKLDNVNIQISDSENIDIANFGV